MFDKQDWKNVKHQSNANIVANTCNVDRCETKSDDQMQFEAKQKQIQKQLMKMIAKEQAVLRSERLATEQTAREQRRVLYHPSKRLKAALRVQAEADRLAKIAHKERERRRCQESMLNNHDANRPGWRDSCWSAAAHPVNRMHMGKPASEKVAFDTIFHLKHRIVRKDIPKYLVHSSSSKSIRSDGNRVALNVNVSPPPLPPSSVPPLAKSLVNAAASKSAKTVARNK
jgi:hypothetical protein